MSTAIAPLDRFKPNEKPGSPILNWLPGFSLEPTAIAVGSDKVTVIQSTQVPSIRKGYPMNHLPIGKLVLATCILTITSAQGQAQVQTQGVRTAHLLSGGTSCLHVIRLIQIHGVNNSFDIGATQITAHPSPFGAYAVPGAELGDLEIVQIAQVPQADSACGPQFTVTIRNNSCRDVCNFHVTVVATLGRIFPGSPNATTCVDKLCAGATADVCVQLPIEALAMGNLNGQVIGFRKIIVAIDAYDELAETNEANNLRALACTEIPLVTAAVVETLESSVTETVVADSSADTTAAPAAISNPTSAPAAVAPNAAPLEQEAPTGDALRSAIRMMDAPTQAATVAEPLRGS